MLHVCAACGTLLSPFHAAGCLTVLMVQTSHIRSALGLDSDSSGKTVNHCSQAAREQEQKEKEAARAKAEAEAKVTPLCLAHD